MIPRITLLLFTALIFSLTSCSSDEKSPAQSQISKQTEQAGKDAAAAIKTPIKKAEAVTDLQNEHNQTLQEQAKSQ